MNLLDIILSIVLFSSGKAAAQQWGNRKLDEPVCYVVEKVPEFPGGRLRYFQYISDNLKLPDSSNAAKSARPFYARIFIDKTGKVVFAEIDKHFDENYSNTILHMISKMPAWEPGYEKGRAVASAIRIPILFADQDTPLVGSIEP